MVGESSSPSRLYGKHCKITIGVWARINHVYIERRIVFDDCESVTPCRIIRGWSMFLVLRPFKGIVRV